VSSAFWFSGVRFRDGEVHYTITGARIPIDASFLSGVLAWLTYYVPIRIRAAICRLARPGPKVWFTPHHPRPWYLIWNASSWIGARQAASACTADVGFYFEDATWGPGASSGSTPFVNGACTDVSKSHVARVFEIVFGYPLAVDPQTSNGELVEKSEFNGAHDGRVISGSAPPREGYVYQKLIETGDQDFVEDLRTPCVAGEPVVVFIKRRLRRSRFANQNASVSLADPRQIFSPTERANIKTFARAMNLDWGGLDILRDRVSGRIYIVDVNKTDMPPLALPFADKMRAISKLGAALDRLLRDFAQRRQTQ
jgi:hypothetical protein